MRNLLFFLLAFSFLLPVSFAKEGELSFSFELPCSDDQDDATCFEEIPSEKDGQVLKDFSQGKVRIFLDNPKAETVTSFRVKLKYDPKLLHLSNLTTQGTIFGLPEPFSNVIAEEEGTLSLGGSIPGGSKNEIKMFLAEFSADLVSPTEMEFLNFQKSELGDTGIYLAKGFEAINLLTKEPQPLFFGKVSSPSEEKKDDLPLGGNEDPVEEILIQPLDPIDEDISEDTFELSRPQGVQIQTDKSGKVSLLWELEEGVQGYYVYYSEKSGFYIRRKDVGKTNFVEFPGFEKGRTFYFAVTAYDDDGNESDYSNEVSVTVGVPGSESNGFSGNPQEAKGGLKNPKKYAQGDLGTTNESGPGEMLFFFFLSMGVVFLLFAFRIFRRYSFS